MALKRCLLETGMGVDLHGKDYTTAAQRAVSNAISSTNLFFVRSFGSGADSMRVDVTIGVPEPEAVNVEEVLKMLPAAQAHPGGQGRTRGPQRRRLRRRHHRQCGGAGQPRRLGVRHPTGRNPFSMGRFSVRPYKSGANCL